jgi:excisionase family DNA binding protein
MIDAECAQANTAQEVTRSVATTVMTLEEVAVFLRVHPSTVYRLLRLRHIPAFKLGSDWRFRRESIEDWLAQQEISIEELIPRKVPGSLPDQKKQTPSKRRQTNN